MTMGAHTVDFGGEAISFQVERTLRRKTIAISVGYDGVRVLAPVDVTDDHILGVIRKKGPVTAKLCVLAT